MARTRRKADWAGALDRAVASIATGKVPAVSNDNPPKEEAELKGFTGWKLDLCRAVRADHKVTAAAASLFAAIMDYVNKDSKKAWPSEGMLSLNLGANRKTIRKYLQVLIDAKWIKADGKSKSGTTIYVIQDYRMNQVLDQLALDKERFKVKEAHRQQRRRSLRIANVCPQGGTPVRDMSVHMGSELSVHTHGHEHLQVTPSDNSSTEGGNTYGRASNGW